MTARTPAEKIERALSAIPSFSSGRIREESVPPGRAVLWSGHLYDFSGYAKANREILFRVANTFRVGILEDRIGTGRVLVDELTQARLSVHRKVRVPDDAPLLRFYTPLEEDAHQGRARILFTMMETSRVHPGMAEKVNAHYSELWTPTYWNERGFLEAGVKVPVRVVPLGVDPFIYRPREGASLPPCELLTTPEAGKKEVPRGFGFIYVSQPTFRKAFDEAILAFERAFADDPEAFLVLGSTAHDYQFWTVNPFGSAGDPKTLRSRIYRLSGRFTEEEMASVYASCEAYLCTSLGEGWNLPLTEAAACGLPVVAPRHSAHLDFLDDRNAFLFDLTEERLRPEGDPISEWYRGMPFPAYNERSRDELVRLLARVRQDPQEARRRATLLRTRILTEYTWDHAAAKAAHRLMMITGA